MSTPYILYGSELSPYSVKLRSYVRYKAIPHRWVARRAENQAEFERHARLPILPTVVAPDGEDLQDSTPIIERIEALNPAPSIHPPSPALAFLSALVEEMGDEWGNKLMFHSRWWAEVDQMAAANTCARLQQPDAGEAALVKIAAQFRERMMGRRHFVGSSAAAAPLITAWFIELVDLLEAHLQGRRYLFGARPAFGDFGLGPEMFEAAFDPSCGAILRSRGAAVLDWCFRMNEPRADGPFEDWPELAPTLAPILAYTGRYFLPWSDANARALAAGEAEFTVELGGKAYAQPPQKYHAKSLAALRAKFHAVAGDPELGGILDAAGCLAWLR